MRSLRKVVFWSHLTCALAAGVVILTMSVTGVLLAFEPQFMGRAERSLGVDAPADAARLPLEEIVAAASAHFGPSTPPTSLVVMGHPRAPVRVHSGRDRRVYVDPYRARVLSEGFPRMEAFFEGLREWHRWLNFPESSVRRGRAVTGAANLVFMFLVVSGLFLWVPRSRRWRRWRLVMWFRRGVRGRARDFNWHNVIGSWSALPLLMIIGSAAVISYPALADRVYPAFSSVVPASRIAGTPASTGGSPTLSEAVRTAAEGVPGWREIELRLPSSRATEIDVLVRLAHVGQPQKSAELTLDRETGEVTGWETFADLPAERRAQQFLRYAHTGEYWGLPGQLVIALFSLAASLMVWTGVSLAVRRLRRSLARRPQARG